MELPSDSPFWYLLARWEELHRQGQDIPVEELSRDHPELVEPVRQAILALRGTSWLDRPVTEEVDDTTPDALATAEVGEYVLMERIGVGGMGRVYKARHRRMDRIVALKILPEGAGDSALSLERFQQEVRAAAKLHHPNIVTAYDAGEVNGRPFLVMEYVEGCDLARHLQAHGPLGVREGVGVVLQVALALAYAHGQGIVHGDIKPANLLLTAVGDVKVLDLGLAGYQATHTGEPAGTVDYLPPERMISSSPIDARSDIYSLGCTLFTLLTGRPLFPGRTAVEKMLAHREGRVPSLGQERADVPSTLEAVFRRMVARDPADRWQSMEQVVEALKQAQRLHRPRWFWGVAAVVLAVVLMGSVGYLAVQGVRQRAVTEGSQVEQDKEEAGKADSIDLLKIVNPEKHTHKGRWELQSGDLVSSEDEQAIVEIPCLVPEEYTLKLQVVRQEGGDAFGIGLVVGGRRCLVVLDAFPKGGHVCGLEMIDGKHCAINETTRRGPVFQNGKASEVLCSVRRGGVLVAVDGITVIDWTGSAERLSLSDYWMTPTDRTLFVGSQYSAYRINKMELMAMQTGRSSAWDHLDVAQAVPMGDFVRIRPQKGALPHVLTKQAYAGPIEVTAVARTAKNNIRLNAFDISTVIFNCEGKPGDFRVHRPLEPNGDSGTLAVSKPVPLSPNTWYTLRWRITEDGMTVFVDGKEVFSEERRYDLSKARPVRVHALDSDVDVKSLVVTQPEARDVDR